MSTVRARAIFLFLLCLATGACMREAARSSGPSPARNLVIITVDTLRADRVGAYGYARARTPAMDTLAARGARFDRAYATAPVTLPSHASLMTGRYPPGHGARDNGVQMDPAPPTLAESLSHSGLATGGFVGAFPLDRRFGIARGFSTYGDRMPRGAQGRPANERPGHMVVDEAIAWLNSTRSERFFLWVHLFEPHAPYGSPGDRRPVADRYDDEIAEADRQIGRVMDALGDRRDSTAVIVTADHGEAFGEHGEIGHSIFIYDTTLRVPLIMAGPSIAPRVVDAPVTLVDVAPTVMRLLGTGAFDADGVDLSAALGGGTLTARELYAESFAPLITFGWSPLRSIRADGYKYIAAPRPELYAIDDDRGEARNLLEADPKRAASMSDRVERISPAVLTTRAAAALDADAAGRLQALGYASGGPAPASGARADPKDRRELAARIAQVTSGELSGPALEKTLREILKDDPQNPLARLRLGYVLEGSNRCREAEPHFRAVIAAKAATADAHLGLAGCLIRGGRVKDALATLRDAERVEPGNAVVIANVGIVLSDTGHADEAIRQLQRALVTDPDLHQARFALAIAFARVGRRAEAADQAAELLKRLPSNAPQRAEVERLLASVR